VSGNATYDSYPHSRVVHNLRVEPSDEELAALIAVLAGVASVTAAESPTPHSAWADLSHRLRTPLHPGPGAWRISALPR
jgi:hypothetical protein